MILGAEGNAQAVLLEANARADSIRAVAQAVNQDGGTTAIAQQLAEQYVAAFEKLAREGTVALLPVDGGDVASVVGKAFTAFNSLKGQVEGVEGTEGMKGVEGLR